MRPGFRMASSSTTFMWSAFTSHATCYPARNVPRRILPFGISQIRTGSEIGVGSLTHTLMDTHLEEQRSKRKHPGNCFKGEVENRGEISRPDVPDGTNPTAHRVIYGTALVMLNVILCIRFPLSSRGKLKTRGTGRRSKGEQSDAVPPQIASEQNQLHIYQTMGYWVSGLEGPSPS